MKFTFPPESRPLEGYTIKRGIRRGGFGEVYYALSDAGKEAALKLLQQNLEIELRGVSQCLNLKHPNLVTIFDIRTDADGDHWIIMEFVAGKGLDQVLAESPDGLPLKEVQHWLSGIVAGVGFLHDRGIVHRDLKPANIYSENDIVKTGDVGLSKFISTSRRSAHTQSVGTVYYMAPEVARGRYGKEVDVYALGIILYELLTGHVPFEGETTGEILMKHLSEQPDLSPIPERFRPVLANALQKEPEKRTPSVTELERQFNNALRGREVPVEIPESSSRRAGAATGRPNGERQAKPEGSTNRSVPPQQRHAGPTARHNVPVGVTPWYHHPGSVFLLAAAIIVLLRFAPAAGGVFASAFALVVYAVLIYGLYRLIQFCLRSGSPHGPDWGHHPSPLPPSASGPPNQTGTAGPVGQTFSRQAIPVRRAARASHRTSHVRLTPHTRRTIPMCQRMTEATGAMAVAFVCTIAITAGVYFLTSFLADPGAVGLFAMTTLLGAWAVVLPSKLWEGRRVENGTRRLTLLIIGALLGTAVYWLDGTLMVDLPRDGIDGFSGILTTVGVHPLRGANQQPTLACYAAFFASLFCVRRWWWHTDSFRPGRLRVSSLLWTAVVAFLMAMVWQFPATWATMWAVAISSVVQLSSVWHAPDERRRLLEDESHG